jgi:hypothetical protein
MALHQIYDTTAEVDQVADRLWSVKNCFGNETFKQLSNTHLNYVDIWHRHPDCLEFRLQLTPDSPTLSTLNEMSHKMLPALETITEQSLMPAECKMWLDLSNWHCPYHSDAELLVVTYQVYLWTHGTVHGTEFCHSDPRTRLDFLPNTGYINLNTDLKQHHADTITGTRLSACFQYRRK